MGSFDVIIGMDWLSLHRAEILCFEKIIHIPIEGGMILNVTGERPFSQLNLMSCLEAQRYLRKKHVAFLAHVTTKAHEEKQLSDIPIVRDFPEVFPEDISGLPPIRQVEFRIDLVPGANPVTKAPDGIRTFILDEAHKSRYSIHPGADQMYADLRPMFWWPGMKKDIAIYVSKGLTCSKVKAEHQKPFGLLEQPPIPVWKWEDIAMDFVTKIPTTQIRNDSIWGVVRFGKRNKLSPRFVGPFEIVERVGRVAYRLDLPEELSNVHPTFHVSNLKKCLAEGNLHIPLDKIQVDESMLAIEKPVEIMDRMEKETKRSRIPIVKVRWESKHGPEFTW
ncbi:uncharacterized protein LOC143622393 [Bidens hawaiensis]|uniref:uncharacterized protein LOC143622393 n=1 Tax=Bidens hawaiensis TaxID=980011 RepID=UPI00404AA11B